MSSLDTRHIDSGSDPSERRVDTTELGNPQGPSSVEADSLGTRLVGSASDQPGPTNTRHAASSPSTAGGDLNSNHVRAPEPGAGLSTRQINTSSPTSDQAPEAQQMVPAEPVSLAEGTLPAGTLLQSRYEIIGVLGMGGMSTVYKARDLRFANVNRLCAVKEMVNPASDPQIREIAIQNFEREANILATTNHPAMPQIYDFFGEANRHYLVMEMIDGWDLEDHLAESTQDEFLDEGQVIDWALQLCDVLAYLHRHRPQPIVFRDLKPGNIMLEHQGRIRLIDFGIAKVFQTGQKGTMIGTEGYSPPEQYRGSAEPRGDIYALGATLHHLLTKQDPRLEPPFSFQERPIRARNANVNAQLEAAIMRALEYDIDKRFSSIEEFRKAIVAATRLGSVRLPQTSSYSYGAAVEASEIAEIWRFACEDEVRSSPTIKDDVLYIGAYDHNLYALKAQSGEFLWKYPTEGGIASTPFVQDEQVLIGSADRTLYSINARTGRLEWFCSTQGRIWSSPRVEFGHVFFGSDDHHLYAVSAQTGRVAWKREMGGPVRSSVAFGEDILYFGCEDGSILAYDIRGEMKWRQRARRAVTSTPYLDLGEGILFAGSMDWNVYALDARSGWVVWRTRTNGPVVSSPTLANGMVFIGSADKHMYALDARNGRVVWKYETEGQVTSNPRFAKGAIYFGGIDEYLYSLDAETGELRWRFKTGGPIPSSPEVMGDVVYIGSTDRNVYAVPT
jgi:outer membrane protein assembly factor BamB/tRNA A-37 threonylcarbamoyl transferase component Bud32